jgi:hypothetical protein
MKKYIIALIAGLFAISAFADGTAQTTENTAANQPAAKPAIVKPVVAKKAVSKKRRVAKKTTTVAPAAKTEAPAQGQQPANN